MKQMASAVLWRYVALGLQFFTVIAVTRNTSLSVAGAYFSLFSVLTVSSVIGGLGCPDGLVRTLPAMLVNHERDRAQRAFASAAVSIVVTLPVMAVIVYCLMMLFGRTPSTGALFSCWWIGYAIVFAESQLLVAINEPSAGSFIGYSAIAISYAALFIPYLFIIKEPSLNQVLMVASGSSWAAGILGAIILRRYTSRLGIRIFGTGKDWKGVLQSAMLTNRLGLSIVGTRLVQSSYPWMPVWVLTAWTSSGQVALYSAASRIAVAASSVIAATRFSVRPKIVTDWARRDTDSIASLARQASAVSITPALLGLAALAIAPTSLFSTILGKGYGATRPIIMILMLGVICEAIGGISDEILKMVGRARFVLMCELLGLASILGVSLALVSGGAKSIAYATVSGFAVQYFIQVASLPRLAGVRVFRLRRRATG